MLTVMPSIIHAIIIFIVMLILTAIICWLVKRVSGKILKNCPRRDHLVGIIQKAATFICWIVGGITILGTFNVDVTALVTGLGLTGFAAGFAFKDILSNALSGLLIMLYSPFDKGDFIQVKSYSGKVVTIDFRYTTLALDDETVLVPNATLITEVIQVKQ